MMSELLHITHASLVFLILALMVVLICLCVLYIRHDYYLKIKKRKPQWMANIPSLEKMNRWIVSLFYVSFTVLTLIVLNGIVLAHNQWNENWLSQPKFLLALSTWFYFFMMFLIRKWKGLRGVAFLLWLLIGCLMVCFSMYGAYVWK